MAIDLAENLYRWMYEVHRAQVIAARQERDRLEAYIREEQPPAPFQPLDQRSLNALYMPWTMACWANQSDDPGAAPAGPLAAPPDKT